jgi:cAMP-dependent protein kinase regulator
MQNVTRMATVVVTSKECICLVMKRDAFVGLVGSNRIAFDKRGAVSAEHVHPDDHEAQQAELDAIPSKDAETSALLTKCLLSRALFKHLENTPALDRMVAAFKQRIVAKDEVVITQGESGDHFYIVESGNFEVRMKKPGGPADPHPAGPVVDTKGPEASFGELALLYNAPRNATLTATVPSVVWQIDRVPFRHLMQSANVARFLENKTLLNNIPDISLLSEPQRARLAEAVEEVSAKAGTVIVRQGDMGDSFYIVKKGTVVVTKLSEDKKTNEMYPPLGVGKYFGELALRRSTPRAATVTAQDNVVLLRLSRQVLYRGVGGIRSGPRVF